MPSQRWRCHLCGEVSPSYAAAERHARQAEHGRIDVEFPTGLVAEPIKFDTPNRIIDGRTGRVTGPIEGAAE